MATEYHVPVMFHSGDTYAPTGRIKYSHPIHIVDVAVDHPDMKISIFQLGNPLIKDCMEVVYKKTNVYADFSGLVLGDFSDNFEKFMKGDMITAIRDIRPTPPTGRSRTCSPTSTSSSSWTCQRIARR